MKRFLTFLLVLVMTLCTVGCTDGEAMATNDEICVSVNGQKVVFDQEPIMLNDRVMVPIRKICDELGAETYYIAEGDFQIIAFVKGDVLVTMINGLYGLQDGAIDSWRINRYQLSENDGDISYIYNYNSGNESIMEVQPVIINGRTLVPVRMVSEYLGANVNWVGETKTVEITADNATAQRTPEQADAMCRFAPEQADSIFINLPENKNKMDATEAGFYYMGWGFNKNGIVHAYSGEDSYVYVYTDGKVHYVDFNTGDIINTIDAKVPEEYMGDRRLSTYDEYINDIEFYEGDAYEVVSVEHHSSYGYTVEYDEETFYCITGYNEETISFVHNEDIYMNIKTYPLSKKEEILKMFSNHVNIGADAWSSDLSDSKTIKKVNVYEKNGKIYVVTYTYPNEFEYVEGIGSRLEDVVESVIFVAYESEDVKGKYAGRYTKYFNKGTSYESQMVLNIKKHNDTGIDFTFEQHSMSGMTTFTAEKAYFTSATTAEADGECLGSDGYYTVKYFFVLGDNYIDFKYVTYGRYGDAYDNMDYVRFELN